MQISLLKKKCKWENLNMFPDFQVYAKITHQSSHRLVLFDLMELKQL